LITKFGSITAEHDGLTGKIARLEENVKATEIKLAAENMKEFRTEFEAEMR